MGWSEVIAEVEAKALDTLRGTYRPLDNVRFFRVQYPPVQEREALRQFRQLAERLRHRQLAVDCVSLLDAFRQALAVLLNSGVEDLASALRELERGHQCSELQSRLSEHLPDEIVRVLKPRLRGIPSNGAAILLRMSSLYPFVRPSSLLSRLEGQVECLVVLPYPGTVLGALLDTAPADPRGGYYRGEVIPWQ